ncbi:hypothetical protein PSU4_32710 [Pseudonocardia sulfidoxydans NBRC 16205]|uniref:Uncharacterized protein n=1 Tax=Pseudonocardia sulfidoxydans NBRC 16205 TaxID=1223511 RepID=A0A511DIP0_9PSEU|nr:hypothetical protein [Pseudonocardia sulfidoxydans]GEL24317.1 hypothetical protein PSU4_32710 [Pseudonocardia sulfidoxydans NBRC 16205]
MPSQNDASVKLIYAVDENQFFAVDDVALDAPFDVIMNVEIGEELNRHVTRSTARIGIRNLTQSKTVATLQQTDTLNPAAAPFLAELRFSVAPGWGVNAAAGDVLQVVASYKVEAGVDSDVSYSESQRFIVS